MIHVSDDLKALSMNNEISDALKHVLIDHSNHDPCTSVALKTSRNSFYVAETLLYTSVLKLYARCRLSLRKEDADNNTVIQLSVICEDHRKCLKTGKVYLRESDVAHFMRNTCWNEKYCIAVSLPLSIAEKRPYNVHPFYDLDRKSEKEILITDESREHFRNVWHSFLCQQLHREDIQTIVSQGAYTTSGIHVQVYGCSVTVEKLKSLWKAAETKLGNWLWETYELKIDVKVTAAFVPGCSKTGNYIDGYRNLFDDDGYYFPFCIEPCSCEKFIEQFAIQKSENGLKYSLENVVNRVYSKNKQILDIWRKERNHLFTTADKLVCVKRKRKCYSRFYNHKHAAVLLIALAYRVYLENWNKSFFQKLDIHEFVDDCTDDENSYSRTACRYLAQNIILDEIESDLDLHNFRKFLTENFDKYFDSIVTAVDERWPTFIEIIYSLMHVSFWIGQDCGEMGSFTVNNEAITKCERLYDIMASYCQDWVTRDDEIPSATIQRKLAKVKQRGEFTLSVISPYDGISYWSFSATPSWVTENIDDCYKENILKPNFELCKTASQVKLNTTDKNTIAAFKSTIQSCSHFVQQTWKRFSRIPILPPNLLVCSNGKIFNKNNGEEFLQLPCFRFDHVLRTGVDEDVFQCVRKSWKCVLEYYQEIENEWFTVGPELNDANTKLSILAKDFRKNLKHINLKQFVRGSHFLLELFVSRERLWYVIDLIVDILMNNERKKVIFCYSPEANHGKSTFSKVISLLFDKACTSVAFSSICSDNESEAKNPALVQAAGKTVIIVDELPGCASSISSPRSTQISPYFLKLLTSNSETNGVRNLNRNSTNLYFYSATFIFANELPDFSVFSEAEVSRMHFVKFEHCYTKHSHETNKRVKRDLQKIIVDMKVALEYLTLARSASNQSITNIDPKVSVDYKNVCYETKENIVKRFYVGLSEYDKAFDNPNKLRDKLEDFVKCKHANYYPAISELKSLLTQRFDEKRN